MYVCGITPYDATHLGHAAMYLAFDLVHRVWLDAGHEVHYVLTKSADLKFICSPVGEAAISSVSMSATASSCHIFRFSSRRR
jgi:hypothetical protein